MKIEITIHSKATQEEVSILFNMISGITKLQLALDQKQNPELLDELEHKWFLITDEERATTHSTKVYDPPVDGATVFAAINYDMVHVEFVWKLPDGTYITDEQAKFDRKGYIRP